MPEKLERCVREVMAEGYAEKNAYAICTAALEGSARPDGLSDSIWQLAIDIFDEKQMTGHFIFSQLSVDDLRPGKAFDGLTVVETLDMNGRPVTVTADELPLYLANTQAAIAAARSASGELVGLPIDAGKTGDHDKGDAGGWIVGVELAGNVLRLTPKWTELGKELISKSIRRFFSATVDTVNKVILGGTLTNWPAVRDESGKMLLRPIELSHSLYELADESLDERSMKIRQAFHMAYEMPDMSEPYINEVFDGYVICRAGDSLYRVDYTETDGEIAFAGRETWIEVKPSYVEAALKFIGGLFKKPAPVVKSIIPKVRFIEVKGEEPMTVKLADLTQADQDKLISDLAAKLTAGGAGQFGDLAAKLVADTRKQAEIEFKAEAARQKRENEIAELSMRIVTGTPEAPRGLKGVTADELKKHLIALPADESKFFGDLLAGIVKDGLIEFSEIGHGRRIESLKPVPDFARKSLAEAVKAGHTPAEFFELAGLGDPTHYDLTPFVASGGNGNGNGKA